MQSNTSLIHFVTTRHHVFPAMMMISTKLAAYSESRLCVLLVTLDLVKEELYDLLLVREIASMMFFQAVNFSKFIGDMADEEDDMNRAAMAELG